MTQNRLFKSMICLSTILNFSCQTPIEYHYEPEVTKITEEERKLFEPFIRHATRNSDYLIIERNFDGEIINVYSSILE